MTTRIDNVCWVRPDQANLTIDARDAKRLIDKYEDDFPEYCFLRDLEDKISQSTKEKVKCRCGTQSYGNAKFCRECGTKLEKKSLNDLELNGIDWHDDDYESYAANTFFPVFVEKVVPCLRGYAECEVTYGDDNDDDEDIKFKTAHFIINNGELTWCEIRLQPGAEAPTFEANDPYRDNGDEENDDEDDDEDR